MVHQIGLSGMRGHNPEVRKYGSTQYEFNFLIGSKMVLQDFKLASWLGILSGVLLFQRPWDRHDGRSLKWLSWNSLYALLILLLEYTIYFEGQVNSLSFIFVSKGEKAARTELLLRLIIGIIFISFHLAEIFVRLYYLVGGKRIASFLAKLEELPVPEDQDGIRANYRLGLWALLLIKFFFRIYAIFNSTPIRLSWLSTAGNWVPYLVMVLCVPSWVIQYISICLVTSATRRLIFIMTNFCDELEAQVSLSQAEFEKNHLDINIFGINTNEQEHGATKSVAGAKPLKEKFTEIKNLFAEHSEVMGMINLCLVTSTVLTVLYWIYDLLVVPGSRSSLSAAIQGVGMLADLCNFIPIEVGQRAHDKIAEQRSRLKPYLSTISARKRREGDEALACFLAWKWRMDACKFFNMDRSVLGGMVATTMSYTVIMVQLTPD